MTMQMKFNVNAPVHLTRFHNNVFSSQNQTRAKARYLLKIEGNTIVYKKVCSRGSQPKATEH